MTELRVGTANIKQTLPDDVAAAALAKVLPDVDVLVLNEWPGRRNRLLDAHGPEWQHMRALLGTPPLVVHADRFRFVSDRFVHLSPTRTASVYRLEDLTTGARVTVIGFHLPARVEARGLYRRIRGALTEQAAEHRRARRALRRLFHDEARSGAQVFAAGDTNFSLMRLRGARSCWARWQPPIGTHGPRLIDTVYAQTYPIWVTVLPMGPRPPAGPDHRAVVATYQLPTRRKP